MLPKNLSSLRNCLRNLLPQCAEEWVVFLLLSALSFVILTGCASVKIDDHEWCTIAGEDGAYCFHTISDKQRDLTKAEWESLSRGWLAGSPQAYGNLKTAVEQLCSETNKCKYEEVQAIKAFFSKIEEAQLKAKEAAIPLIEVH